ncbi:DNA cytosine methyltransferase [Nocardioides sp. WL0053]|uniref:DNA (cytosine-5-)-methyltransferase n=1 Tax=Nocardioides jiangsuensis TaxID=2866161 RepID=A0ABS7RLM7_9ACTN|nr:DNA (cytosine-5-)-methyltransferase [Nocardioides jiangsuensis]MBY9075946.1 DNA cytosine methyltransferase [Nocardioides jiangsuensis]
MFDFVDLFAGIGGFHGSLASLGGRGVRAAELDRRAREVYKPNWHLMPDKDVRDLAQEAGSLEDHAVLAAGFPCQPFSKSGRQLGMSEERGTLFHEIVTILEAKKPPVIFLENVRNIAGPRQRATWRAVVDGLREVGYKVSDQPCVFSPHLLPPEAGGAAQVRERVYILATYVGPERAHNEVDVPPAVEHRPQLGWDPQHWSIKEHVVAAAQPTTHLRNYRLTPDEIEWIDTWNRFLKLLPPGAHLPGHPLWADVWTGVLQPKPEDPDWKKGFIAKNVQFYVDNKKQIDAWLEEKPRLRTFPASRRKLEWQAQDAPRDLWQLLLHLRPSGIRAKRPTYAPALVAMGQTSIYGPERRRLTVEEAAVLQGFPRGFKFGGQVDSLSYRQLGNAINIGTARYVFSRYVEQNADDIEAAEAAGAKVDGHPVVEAVMQVVEAERAASDVAAETG